MLKVITKKDIELLINFYKSINDLDDDHIRQIYDDLEYSKLMFASINKDKIDYLLSVNIINNNYHMEKLLFKEYDESLTKDLISFAITELRKDDRGLNVIYDNFPYDEVMNEIMLEQGFKCNYLNMSWSYDGLHQELIKPSISLNDKKDDVTIYIYRRLIEDIKSNDIYLGTNSLIPDISTIRLENTNVAVTRDEAGNVTGTLRFGIVSNSILLDSMYADNELIYKDLINLVRNLTNKDIEISITPSRVNIIKLLESFGFKKIQTDYIFKLN